MRATNDAHAPALYVVCRSTTTGAIMAVVIGNVCESPAAVLLSRTPRCLLRKVYATHASVPALVRRALRTALADTRVPDTAAADLEFAVNELVTNSVVHAAGSVVRVYVAEHDAWVDGNTAGHTLVVVVCDSGPGRPRVTPAGRPGTAEHGYGLAAVRAITGGLETHPCAHGKAVAFRLVVEDRTAA